MSLPKPGDIVCAGLDMGLRSDSSTLVVIHRRGDMLYVGDLIEMRPEKGAPLKPSVVVRRFAKTMLAHGCSFAVADAHYAESVREYLDEYDLSLAAGPSSPAEAYVRARALMREGRIRIPRHARLIQQLKDVQGKPTSGGGMSIQHPRTSNGGHGDIAAAFVLAVWQLAGDETADAVPDEGSREWEARASERRRQKYKESVEERPAWMPKNRVRERFS